MLRKFNSWTNREEIKKNIYSFSYSTKLSLYNEFNGVEIHYLIICYLNNFFINRTNVSTDEWGLKKKE